MLIACKCLNILLKSASDLPTILSTSNHDDDIDQLQFEQRQKPSSPAGTSRLPLVGELQPCTVNNLKGDHLQFFKTVKKNKT